MTRITRRSRRRSASNTRQQLAVFTAPLTDDFSPSCDCPICAALAELDTQVEVLPDGTRIQYVDPKDAERIAALVERNSQPTLYN